jgi:hypothetical protein
VEPRHRFRLAGKSQAALIALGRCLGLSKPTVGVAKDRQYSQHASVRVDESEVPARLPGDSLCQHEPAHRGTVKEIELGQINDDRLAAYRGFCQGRESSRGGGYIQFPPKHNKYLIAMDTGIRAHGNHQMRLPA